MSYDMQGEGDNAMAAFGAFVVIAALCAALFWYPLLLYVIRFWFG